MKGISEINGLSLLSTGGGGGRGKKSFWITGITPPSLFFAPAAAAEVRRGKLLRRSPSPPFR